ncbi:hypothetical protein ACFLYM_00195 [Chloroflexota bacterium]
MPSAKKVCPSLENCPAIIEAKEAGSAFDRFISNDFPHLKEDIGFLKGRLFLLLWIIPVSISLVSGIVIGLLKLFG